jgi:hypothetical protein
MIPPPAQQMMAKLAGVTILESEASDAVDVSRPEAVASISKAPHAPDTAPQTALPPARAGGRLSDP